MVRIIHKVHHGGKEVSLRPHRLDDRILVDIRSGAGEHDARLHQTVAVPNIPGSQELCQNLKY